MKAMLQQHSKAARSLSGVASFAAVAGLMATFVQPAMAAPLSGNALPVIFGPSGVSNGSPVGTINTAFGPESFEVIFDSANLNGISVDFFDVNKFLSLQVASIKTPSGGGTISFQDVQFFVDGSTNSSFQFGGAQSIANASIAVWQPSPTAGSQGFGNYTFSDPVVTTSPALGTGTNYRKASFDLTPLASPNAITGLDAGQINTLAFNPSAFGIATITKLRIKGLITNSSAIGAAAGFGLASFNSDPALATQQNPVPPSAIAGRAADVNATAPGPLPVLGASAAFGMSRRLRRRIGASKVAA